MNDDQTDPECVLLLAMERAFRGPEYKNAQTTDWQPHLKRVLQCVRDNDPMIETLRTRVAELEKAMGKFLDRDCAIVERDITMRFESHDQACTSLREMLAAIIAVEATE